MAVGLATIIGVLLGLLAGYIGGWLDSLITLCLAPKDMPFEMADSIAKKFENTVLKSQLPSPNGTVPPLNFLSFHLLKIVRLVFAGRRVGLYRICIAALFAMTSSNVLKFTSSNKIIEKYLQSI